MATPEQKQLFLDHLKSATPEQWLAVMRWCVRRLAYKDHELLATVVAAEADRRARGDTQGLPAALNAVLKDLDLMIGPENDFGQEDE